MATITAHELAYLFEEKLYARLKSLRVSRPRTVAAEITPALMDEVPTEAFEPKPAWERGFVFMHGDFEERYVLELQSEILTVHGNIKPAVPITLYLSSFGGSWESGCALYSTIQEVRRAGRTVNCHVQGTAMSMGSIIVQACDVRTIEPFASMMVHENYDGIVAKTSDAKDRVAFQERVIDATFCRLYASRSGKTIEFWREKIARRDVYLTAREAVNLGLVDRIKPIAPFSSKKKANEKVS